MRLFTNITRAKAKRIKKAGTTFILSPIAITHPFYLSYSLHLHQKTLIHTMPIPIPIKSCPKYTTPRSQLTTQCGQHAVSADTKQRITKQREILFYFRALHRNMNHDSGNENDSRNSHKQEAIKRGEMRN